MTITLTGSNSLLLKQALNQLTSAFNQEHGDSALEKLDGDEVGIARIQEALTSVPFLASKKMVVLSSPSSNKEFIEKAESLIDDLPETTDLILVEPKLDKRSSYYKFLKKGTDFKEFAELDAQGLANSLVNYAKENNAQLSLSDARYLAERVGSNQQLLINELDKLMTYEPNVARANIDLLTDPSPQSKIFDLVDAAMAGNTQKALKLYGEQRGLKVEPQQIVAMLAWQLNILAIIKTAGNKTADEIAKDAKINPFVIRKNLKIAQAMPLNDLKQHVKRLSDIDSKSKRTSIDIDEALQHYLLTLGQR